MAVSAADDEALMAAMGEATAVEARHLGVNWVLCPVADLNLDPDNPITNIRALGDRPEWVSRLACALIRRLQQHGVAATATHFPGDGMDDRNQQRSGREVCCRCGCRDWLFGRCRWISLWIGENDIKAVQQRHRFGQRELRLLERVEAGDDGVICCAGEVSLGQVGVMKPRARKVSPCAIRLAHIGFLE